MDPLGTGREIRQIESAVCVDCILSPLGRQAMRDTVVRIMLVAGVSVVRKWLVALESKMAHHLMVAASTVIVLRMM